MVWKIRVVALSRVKSAAWPGLLTRFLLWASIDAADCVCAHDSILKVQEARLRSNRSALLATAPLTISRYEIW